MRIERILCPVDLSEASAHALDHAVLIADQYRARLTVQYVYAPMFMPVPMLPPPVERVPDSAVARAHDDVAAFVKATMGPSRAAPDIAVDVGYATVAILERAAQLSADLIVMGTHGSTGFERFILGSTTEKVLRKASAPVLTVPPRVNATSHLPFRRILCAVDFSPWSNAAVAFAGSLAEGTDAGVTLVHVIEWPWHESNDPSFTDLSAEQASALADYRRYIERGARARLEAIVPTMAGASSRVACVVTHGKSYAEILRVAAKETADLVVMGVHGQNPVERMLFGSTTNHVVRAATCPVLTLRS